MCRNTAGLEGDDLTDTQDTLLKEHIMATQTQRTTQRAAKFHSTTLKTSIVMVIFGLILLSAASSYAALTVNGLSNNGWANGLSNNGWANGLSNNGWANGLAPKATTLQREPLPAGSLESLPFNGLSQRALGKPQP
jgi:hypothetical protein